MSSSCVERDASSRLAVPQHTADQPDRARGRTERRSCANRRRGLDVSAPVLGVPVVAAVRFGATYAAFNVPARRHGQRREQLMWMVPAERAAAPEHERPAPAPPSAEEKARAGRRSLANAGSVEERHRTVSPTRREGADRDVEPSTVPCWARAVARRSPRVLARPPDEHIRVVDVRRPSVDSSPPPGSVVSHYSAVADLFHARVER
jgi:hypothetical protein